MAASDYERFSDGAHNAVVLTERLAREAGRGLAGPEDLLVALASVDPDAKFALLDAGTSAETLQDRVDEWVGGVPGSAEAARVDQARFSPNLQRAVHRAVRLSQQERAQVVSGRHLLRALLDSDDDVVWRVLISVGVDPGPLANRPAPTKRSEVHAAVSRPRFALRLPAWR